MNNEIRATMREHRASCFKRCSCHSLANPDYKWIVDGPFFILIAEVLFSAASAIARVL